MAMHTTTLKEKTMTVKSRFFQASFSTNLLRSTVLAMMLIVPASPARSEVLDLYCKSEGNGNAWSLLIDTDKRTVTKTINGNSFTFDPNAFVTHEVIVSRDSIKWKAPSDCGAAYIPCREEGLLDRIGGTVGVNVIDRFGQNHGGSSGSCRRATQKF